MTTLQLDSIEGAVTLKRKNQWVKRYAKVDGPNRMFAYKDDQSVSKWKYEISLKNAKIMKGFKNETQ